MRWMTRTWAVALPFLTFGLSGCLSPVAMHDAVLAYDRTVTQVGTEQLLLNIARARYHRPIHFTTVSNVAATFDFRVTAGVTPPQVGTNAHALVPIFSGSVAENPTITIVPIEGEEFTKRILTPLDEGKFHFLVRQGIDPSLLLRMMARECRLTDGKQERVIANNPEKADEYQEFRRRTLHMMFLHQARNLYVEPMIFEESLEVPLESVQVLQALKEGYSLKVLDKTRSMVLTKTVIGRLVMTNYDPDTLTNEARRTLHLEATKWPSSDLLVDIRPDHPGGDYPMHGTFRFRSFNSVLVFLAQGIGEQPEYDVNKDPRTGPVRFNPAKILAVFEGDTRPDDAAVAVEYEGRTFAIRGGSAEDPQAVRWNLDAFRVLYQLFQMTVTDVSRALAPTISIAK